MPNSLQTDDAAIDPMADWLAQWMGDIEAEEERYLNVLIHLQDNKTALDLKKGPIKKTIPGWQDAVKIPRLYTKATDEWAKARYCTARVLPRFLRWLQNNSRVQKIVRGLTICESPTFPDPALVPMRGGPEQESTLSPDAIVVGVIDFGLPLVHPDLLQAGALHQTRIYSAWIQDGGVSIKGSPIPLKVPRLFGYGAQWRGKGAVPKAPQPADEIRIYARSGIHKPDDRNTYWTRSVASHGSGVLGLAAGGGQRGNPIKEPPKHDKNRPLILVQLPQATVADGSGQSLAANLLDALRFIALEASYIKAGNNQAPVVVNLSYGYDAGPHDGQSLIEQAIEEVVDLWGKTY